MSTYYGDEGTNLVTDSIGNVSCLAICWDGVLRKTAHIARSADTFFSIPATMRVHGIRVRGFIHKEDQTFCFTPDDVARDDYCEKRGQQLHERAIKKYAETGTHTP